MNSQNKSIWKSLLLIGLVFGAGLVEEARLPFSPAADPWLLALWVLLFYGAVAAWITHNRGALEREPLPLDCIARPIIDNGASEFQAEPDSRDARFYDTSGPRSQSEAI